MIATSTPAGVAAAVPDGSSAVHSAVRMAFSDRTTGNCSFAVGRDGDVHHARRALLRLVGASLGEAVFMEQVHGARVTIVGRGDAGRGVSDHGEAVQGADALVTFAPDVALVVLVADCVPVLLADPGRGIAAVHAGRRGVASDVVGAALAVLAPDAPERVSATIGPAIGGCCYEVPEDLARAVSARVPEAASTTRWGSTGLDLPAAVVAQLRSAGVKRVEQVGECTRCAPQRWFSHRASGVDARRFPEGRQGGVVVRRSVPPAWERNGPSVDS